MMMQYAFDEFHNLLVKLPNPISDQDLKVQYLCGLMAELAYHHIPQHEIDHRKRAKIMPCERYAVIVKGGAPTDVIQYVQTMEMDSLNAFVVSNRGVIAVVIYVNNMLFIGFRGTIWLYDWITNLDVSLIGLVHGTGQFHKGFANEAYRIWIRIMEELSNTQLNNVKHIFLSGHSLGGAVAAINKCLFIKHVSGKTSTCIFGSPRYCDTAAYHYFTPPVHIQRHNDIVPFVPPDHMGYADHPRQFDTSGKPLNKTFSDSQRAWFIYRMILFACKRFESHSIEAYREELGKAAGSQYWDKPLAPYEKLKSASNG